MHIQSRCSHQRKYYSYQDTSNSKNVCQKQVFQIHRCMFCFSYLDRPLDFETACALFQPIEGRCFLGTLPFLNTLRRVSSTRFCSLFYHEKEIFFKNMKHTLHKLLYCQLIHQNKNVIKIFSQKYSFLLIAPTTILQQSHSAFLKVERSNLDIVPTLWTD